MGTKEPSWKISGLARPRRFGKTLLLSTFEELFKNGTELFKEQKIIKNDLWHEDQTYIVMKFDFSLSSQKDFKGYQRAIIQQINAISKQYGLPFKYDEDADAVNSFSDFLNNSTQKSLVLLIDEYDSALTANLSDKARYMEIFRFISDFFKIVKSYLDRFRFVFITGITPYRELNLRSAFNAFDDISTDSCLAP